MLTLGLGDVDRLDRLEILWPSGRMQAIQDPPLRTLLRVQEPGR
jgi:hypothetical protein